MFHPSILLTGYIWKHGYLVVALAFFKPLHGISLYCCFCSEYMTYVLEALEVEDATKNYERRRTTGWFASNFFCGFFAPFQYASKKFKGFSS